MSLFVNMTKTVGAYLSRALESAKLLTTRTQNANHSGFCRWRANFDRFCKHKEKIIVKETGSMENKTILQTQFDRFPSCFKRRRLAMRLRFDKKCLPSGSIPSGMRMARMLSVSALQSAVLSPAASVFRQPIRTKCGRENCEDPCWWPVCPPGNQRWIKEKNKLFNIYEAYWDEKNEACCLDPCKWALPRFDDIYLQESDKVNRIYQRTWHECPDKVKKSKCTGYNCYDGKPIEYCRRPKQERPPTACEMRPCSLGNDKCPKLTDSCCCPVRGKLTCKPLVKGLTDCRKFCTPYPSFSECARSKIRPKHPIECKCLAKPTMCEFWHWWRNQFAHRSSNCS